MNANRQMGAKTSLLKVGSATFELGSGPNRLLGMEGLRGAAVVLVYFVHSVSAFRGWMPTSGVQHDVARFLEINGHAGVDLFFVLSGFLIWPQPQRTTFVFRRFFSRRLERIVPAFVVVFVITAALMIVQPPTPRLIPDDPVKAILYIVANLLFLPGVISIAPIVTVAWTLSYEFLFYLAAPLIWHVGKLRNRSQTVRIAVLIALGLMIIVGRLVFPWIRLRMVLFLAGAILAEVRGLKRTPNVRDPLRWAEWVTIGLLAVTSIVTFDLTITYGEADRVTTFVRIIFLTVGLTAFVWAGLGRTTMSVRMMSWAPLRWLGNMSYSYYLTHFLTLKVFALVIEKIISPQPGPMFWALNMVGFVATLVPSVLLFVHVERRFSLK